MVPSLDVSEISAETKFRTDYSVSKSVTISSGAQDCIVVMAAWVIFARSICTIITMSSAYIRQNQNFELPESIRKNSGLKAGDSTRRIVGEIQKALEDGTITSRQLKQWREVGSVVLGENATPEEVNKLHKRVYDTIANDKIPLTENTNLKEPRTVPLVVYIGTDRRIVGTAKIVGNEITGHIDEVKGDILAQLVEIGAITDITVSFSASPQFRPTFQGNYPGAKSISLPPKEK